MCMEWSLKCLAKSAESYSLAWTQCTQQNSLFSGFTAQNGTFRLSNGSAAGTKDAACINNWIILMHRFDDSVKFDKSWVVCTESFCLLNCNTISTNLMIIVSFITGSLMNILTQIIQFQREIYNQQLWCACFCHEIWVGTFQNIPRSNRNSAALLTTYTRAHRTCRFFREVDWQHRLL